MSLDSLIEKIANFSSVNHASSLVEKIFLKLGFARNKAIDDWENKLINTEFVKDLDSQKTIIDNLFGDNVKSIPKTIETSECPGLPKKSKHAELLLTYPLGVNIDGSGLAVIDITNNEIQALKKVIPREIFDKNEIDYIYRVLRISRRGENATSNSLDLKNPYITKTIFRYIALFKYINTLSESDKIDAYRTVYRDIASELFGDNNPNRIIIESISGTHLWYVVSRELTYQLTESGSKVPTVTQGEDLPVNLVGEKIDSSTSAVKKTVVMMPFRHQTGILIAGKDFKQMLLKYFIAAIEKSLQLTQPFFTFSITLPPKGGAIFSDALMAIRSLKIYPESIEKTIQSLQYLGIIDSVEKLKKLLEQFIKRNGTYELVVDMIQLQSEILINDVLTTLENNKIDGWVLTATSKTSAGQPFGGLAIGINNVKKHLIEHIQKGIISPEKLYQYIGVGFLPNDLEDLIVNQLQKKGLNITHLRYSSSLAIRLATGINHFSWLQDPQNQQGIRLVINCFRKIAAMVVKNWDWVQLESLPSGWIPGRVIVFQVKGWNKDEYFKLHMFLKTTKKDHGPVFISNPFQETVTIEGENVSHPPFGRIGIDTDFIKHYIEADKGQRLILEVIWQQLLEYIFDCCAPENWKIIKQEYFNPSPQTH